MFRLAAGGLQRLSLDRRRPPTLRAENYAIRGTRLSVFLILECLAGGMSLEDIDEAFGHVIPP